MAEVVSSDPHDTLKEDDLHGAVWRHRNTRRRRRQQRRRGPAWFCQSRNLDVYEAT